MTLNLKLNTNNQDLVDAIPSTEKPQTILIPRLKTITTSTPIDGGAYNVDIVNKTADYKFFNIKENESGDAFTQITKYSKQYEAPVVEFNSKFKKYSKQDVYEVPFVESNSNYNLFLWVVFGGFALAAIFGILAKIF